MLMGDARYTSTMTASLCQCLEWIECREAGNPPRRRGVCEEERARPSGREKNKPGRAEAIHRGETVGAGRRLRTR